MQGPGFPPEALRQYALLADGERGALVGPHGDIAFLCAPRWHDNAVFSSLLGGPGRYTVTPADRHHVWGGHYEHGGLIWRGRWVTTRSVIECREALVAPGDRDRLVLLRRIEAVEGLARVRAELECRADFGARTMTFGRSTDGVWQGSTGALHYRWSGAPPHSRIEDGRLCADITVPEGHHLDLVLEIAAGRLPLVLPEPDVAWQSTERHWTTSRPDLGGSAAPGESAHSWAVLKGLTSSDGGMVAAATTSLPERADKGRSYDYRYAWIRDQCYAGVAAAAVKSHDLLDSAVGFVSTRVLDDRDHLRPAYTVDGDPVPAERCIPLRGYPGGTPGIGNHAGTQFQLDTLGEALVLLSAAGRADRLDSSSFRAVEALVHLIQKHGNRPEAGIWELDDRRWAHSRLMCAAGLRAVAHCRRGTSPRSHRQACEWEDLADRLVGEVDADCLHPSGRWQRSPEDPSVDAALLLPGVRGAVPAHDARNRLTVAAVRDDLTDDGYVYRFRQNSHSTLHAAEGAFVLSGFHMALAQLGLGRKAEALRWFERNRAVLGPPGLFAEEFDVVQRQLRGNLPQAFVHAAALETAQRLGDAHVSSRGFAADDR